MRITVRVFAHSNADLVIEQPDGTYKVLTRAVPENGRANREVIRLTSRHFGIPQADVSIVFGKTSREKIIELNLPKV